MTGEHEPAPSPSAEARVVLAALAGLPGMYPARLAGLLAGRPVDVVWRAVLAGAVGDIAAMGVRRDQAELAAAWQRAARATDLEAIDAAHQAHGVKVLVRTDADYPAALGDDPEAPAVLFTQGDPAALDRPAVAVVGTRRCTHAGREIAHWVGQAVAERGGAVVSGLALGIDGAAHRGALRVGGGAVVGVVGSGLDIPYPRRHRVLWSEVRDQGVLLSEAPLGARPAGWRFPARNRIIAALAAVVVVVESHDRGGSLVTARLAVERQREVLVVPGSIRSPASAGTNALLRDGATPLVDLDDLSAAMSLAGAPLPRDLDGRGSAAVGDRATTAETARPANEAAVLAAVGHDPTSTEAVIARTGLAAAAAVVALRRLEADGTVVSTGGGWWERR